MTEKYTITQLCCDNAEQYVRHIAELEQLCFGKRAWTESQLKEEIANTFAVIFAYNLGTELAGYASARSVADELQISNIAVFPMYRKHGIATALLNELLSFGKACGNTVAELEVAVDNLAAQQLYSKFGFVKAGVRRNFYPDDGRGSCKDALTMICQLGQ